MEALSLARQLIGGELDVVVAAVAVAEVFCGVLSVHKILSANIPLT